MRCHHANQCARFRYAESQIANVQSQYTDRDIKRALLGMPDNLNETYSRILQSRNSNNTYRKYVRKMLLWLSFANRPLHLTELCEALVIEEGDVDIDASNRLHDVNMILRLGQGLVVLDDASGYVTLGHSSVKTFITSSFARAHATDYALDERDAHIEILRTCLTYLRFHPFELRPEGTFKALSAKYPLLSYTALNWPLHVRDAGKHTRREIDGFLSTINHAKGGSYAFWIEYVAGGLPPRVLLRTSPLYYAASFGFTELLSSLIATSQPLKLEQPGGRHGSTALQVACFRRQRKSVEILVEAGANPFSPDGSGLDGGFSSLFWAKENGWDDIVELMIKHGTANGFRFRDRSHDKYATEKAKRVQKMVLSVEDGTTLDRERVRTSTSTLLPESR